ncbi:hypothetical protein AWB77_06703 [Caballeronia fortuita]|uniref:Phage tail assembly protein n=1 Tax=Caballeronia fortuita TaxID=1777138 RepID=A0A158E8B3_9BURK|nr:phage tail assembly protein [Caballeronia fortuita]SAL03088.1 hypothetical protein AWB77_06703 [Caballeronia fortuita]
MAGSRKNTEQKPEDFVQHHDGHASITLSRPMNVGGAPVTALKMREPLLRDQVAMQEQKGTDLEREIFLFANLCEITPDQLKALPVRDYNRIVAAYVGFPS